MELDIIKSQTTWNDAVGGINSNFAKIKAAFATVGTGGGGGLDEDELRLFLEQNGYTTENWVKLQKYLTAESADLFFARKEWVEQQIEGIDLSPYAKSTDVANTYATISALSTLQGQYNTLRSEFDALNNLLNDDITGVINTWNEVVDFINEYSGSQDLATILSGMNADISSRLLTSTFDSWKADTYTPLANLVANHTTKLDSIDASITNINTRLEGVDKTIEDHIAEFIAFRANFEISDNLILVRKNFASTEEVSAKGINQGTGGGGGSSYSRLDTWEGYDNNKAGYVLSAGLGYGLKVAIDELNRYDLDNRVRSIENSYVSKDAGGVVNGGLVVSSLAVAGGSSSQFLKADGSLDGTSYLPTSGGTLSRSGRDVLTIDTSDSYGPMYQISVRGKITGSIGHIPSESIGDYGLFISNADANTALLLASDRELYFSLDVARLTKDYTLLHSGNVGDYALKTDGSNTMEGGIKWTLNPTPSSWDSYFDVGGNRGLRILNNVGHSTEGAPSNYAVALAVSGYYGFALAYDAHGSIFKAKGFDSTDWKTIAFTDSTVKAAKTLVTDNGGGLAYFANNTFYVGDTIYPNYETHILGYNVVLRSSPSAATGFILNSAGNVTIGGSDLAGTSYKLYVDGKLRLPYLYFYGNNIYSDTDGLYIQPYGAGIVNINQLGTNTFINNSGGNVGIGTTDPQAKLHVNGVTRIQRDYDPRSYLDIAVDDISVNYNGYDTDGWCNHYFKSNGETRMAIIGLNGYVGIGTADPTYKLDVIGDIRATESITIGGATLSWENGALKVNTSFYSEKEISAKGLSTGGGSGASYNRLDAWGDYDSSKAGYVLSAGLGYDLKLAVDELNGYNLNSRLTTVESNYLSKNGGTITGDLAVVRSDFYSHAIQIGTSDGYGFLIYNGQVDAWYVSDRNYYNAHAILNAANFSLYALPITGGTVNGAIRTYGRVILDANQALEFVGDDNVSRLLFPYAAANYELSYHNGDGWNTILHSGNVGDYAGIYLSSATIDLNEIRYGFRAGKLYNSSNAANAPAAYRGFLEYGTAGFVAQFNSDGQNNLFYRWCENGTWLPWKTIAFTDSDITGNASSATKLQTPRTIWGQSFDGTGDVSGNITLDKAIGINLDDTWTDNSGNTHPWYGLDFTHIESWTTLSSYFGLALKTGSVSIYLNSSGNVGIGIDSPQYKLHVDGTGYFSDAVTVGGDIFATGDITSTYGYASSYYGYRISFNNRQWSGLFSQDRITPGGNANNIWLHVEQGAAIIYGDSGVQLAAATIISSSLSVSGALTANGGLTVSGILTVGGASIHPTANNPYFQLYQNNKYWYWQADDNYAYIGGTLSKALRIDQDGNTLIRGSLGVDALLTASNGLTVSKGISATDGIVSDWITAANITANTSASIAALTVSGLSTLTGGIATNDIHGNGQSLYLGNASNNAYIKVRENMVGSSSMWSIPRDGKATFTSLTTPTLSVTGSATIASVTIDAGNATLSNLTVNTVATLKQLVVGIDGMSCNAPATFNDFIYGSSITPRTDNYYVLGNNNYKWYAVTAYNVNVHDAITIEAGKELRFKDNNGVVHTLKYDSAKQAFVFDGNVNATGEMSAKKLNA